MKRVALTLLLASNIQAAEYIKLKEFSLQTGRLDDNRDPYFKLVDHEQWKGFVANNFNLDLVRADGWSLYWHNQVHTEGTESQLRSVGWRWEAGVNLGDKLEIFHEHHSRHLMDVTGETRFPLYNAYGIKIIMYREDK